MVLSFWLGWMLMVLVVVVCDRTVNRLESLSIAASLINQVCMQFVVANESTHGLSSL